MDGDEEKWQRVAFRHDDETEAGTNDRTIMVRFDAGGMGWWWGIFVGRVCVWSHSATEGPMAPDERRILTSLVLWGTTEVANNGSMVEFRKAIASMEDGDSYDPEVYWSMIGRPKKDAATDLALSICRKITEEGRSGFDGWGMCHLADPTAE